MSERKRKKQDRRKNPKQKDTSIPGFVSEETILNVLSGVFKVRGLLIFGRLPTNCGFY